MQFNNIKGRTVVTHDSEVTAVELGDKTDIDNVTPGTVHLSNGTGVQVHPDTAEEVAKGIDSKIRDALTG